MPIPKLYSVLPGGGDESSISALTDYSSELKEGSDGEKYVVLSYFPEELKLSQLNNFVLNKYVLFVLDENSSADYTVEWDIDVTETIHGEEINILETCILEDIPTSDNNFEYAYCLRHKDVTDSQDWKLTLKITCSVFKGDQKDKTIELVHSLLPIEADLLSSNGASFEDESGEDNSATPFGNEPTTHFVRGHLGEYLVKKKQETIDNSPDPAPDNASVFVNQTAAIAYNNCLSSIENLGPSAILPGRYSALGNSFNWIFVNQDLEKLIIDQNEYSRPIYGNIGICSLNLHHVLPIILGSDVARVDFENELVTEVETAYNFTHDEFISAYHRCVFPKSAIGLSVDIFNKLFAAFKSDANLTNRIYETFETNDADRKSKITEWKNLDFSELRDRGNDRFMKNLIANYYLGHYHTFTKEMVALTKPEKILRIDWSQFIQKILNPSSINVPFTLIKIQVRDLRSGNPIKNALVKRIEFYSYDEESTNSMIHKYPPEITYKYENTRIYESTNSETFYDSEIPFDSDDSNLKRAKKIFRAMGYYTGRINDTYDNDVRTAIHAYLTSADRYLPEPFDVPESAARAHVDRKKDAWIEYIIQDFESNCLTDGDGVLNCRIPDQLLKDRKLKINVGFAQFGVIREIFAEEETLSVGNKPLKRLFPNLGIPTGFEAEWDGNPALHPAVNPNEQNTDWDDNLNNNKNFGWKIIDDPQTTEDYLKVALSLEVKKSKTEDYNFLKFEFSQFDLMNIPIENYSHFSTFYQDTGIHFVLFGMLWSQPIWAPLDSSVTHRIKGGINPAFQVDFSAAGNRSAHPNDGEPQGLTSAVADRKQQNRPYMVTRYLAGTEAHPNRTQYSCGRDYGTLVINGNNPVGNNSLLNADENETGTILTGHYTAGTTPRTRPGGINKTHYGIDYFAVSGDSPVFAITGGIISRSSLSVDRRGNPALFGERINHLIGDYIFTYAHLERRIASTGDIVMSGQKIGIAGRSAVGVYPDYAPTHLHLEMAGDGNDFDSRLSNPKTIVKKLSVHGEHEENADLYLNNASHRLFPCDCSGGTEVTSAQSCHIKSAAGAGVVPNVCWASRNLHCPYMNPDNVHGGVTPAREAELTVFRLQSQLTYLFEDDNNQGIPAGDQYRNPGNIDGAWGNSCENAIQRFRELHIDRIIPDEEDRPPIMDVWWLSQPADGDDTWVILNTEAPYPRTNLNRVDK